MDFNEMVEKLDATVVASLMTERFKRNGDIASITRSEWLSVMEAMVLLWKYYETSEAARKKG